MLSEEVHYRLLTLLAPNPLLSQRDVARTLGMSLGKVNYCIKALVRNGWIKAGNFKTSQNKFAYRYILTPRGLRAKARVTGRFLRSKVREYEALKAEIEQLRKGVEQRARR